MLQYIIVHKIVNDLRTKSYYTGKAGPRILITGSNFSGKNVLCHVLLNYAIRLGWRPTFVDLDLSNEIFVPGCIAAAQVDYNFPNDFTLDNAYALFNGGTANDLNTDLFLKQIEALASAVKQKFQKESEMFYKKIGLNKQSQDYTSEVPNLQASGVIVHVPLLQHNKNNSVYVELIKSFDIDIVFVLLQ